ncbi:MAG: extracellular solute-binding protein, partial [Chloroflexi bacterium]|nr:extracellular solute-binding protein [Chloroflexota bacterium]
MKPLRSLVAVLLVLTLIAPLLAGCTQPAPTAAPTTAPPAQAPSKAPEAAQPAKPLAGKEITALFIADKTWVPDMVKEFEDLTGAKVNVILSDFEEMQTKFTAAAAAKSGAFDVVSGDQPAWFIAGYLEPLDAYMQELDQNDITGLDMRLYQGKRYAMPWLVDNRIFLYNTEILKQAGFDAPPTTWDELFNQAKAIKDQGILDYPIMFPWAQHEGEFCDMSAWFLSAGGQYFNPDFTASLVNSPENAQALDFLKKLYDAGLVNPESLASKSFAVSQTLAQGSAAFGASWISLTGMLEDPNESKAVGQVRATLYPGLRQGLTGTFDGSESLAIAADAK